MSSRKYLLTMRDTRGNFGGPNGSRKTYDTTFDTLYAMHCDQWGASPHRHLYEPTVRGLCRELGIDNGTFHNYRSGKSKTPNVVLHHMSTLGTDEYRQRDYCWQFYRLKIKRRIGWLGEEDDVLLYDIEFDDGFEKHAFTTKRFSLRFNLRFREALFNATGYFAPPANRIAWARAVDEALTERGYIGSHWSPDWEED